jgi:HEAT repeat protein
MSDDIQPLIRQLSSQNPTDQATAAEALARMGKEAQPAAVALLGALRNADAQTMDWCVAALEELGPPPASQVKELIKLANDKSVDAAYWAITLLGRAGRDADSAVSTLTAVLQSSHEAAVRERAAWALGKIGPAARSAVSALRTAAADAEPRLARLAKQALGEIEL